MKKISFRRLSALLLTAAVLLAALPAAGLHASAAKIKGGYFTQGNPPFAYVVTGLKASDGDNTVKLYQNSDMQSYADYDGVYTIPQRAFDADDMRSYLVTEIGGAVGDSIPGALQNVPLRGVVLPGGVTTIGTKAFSGCWNLTEITFPTSVLSMAADAFEGVNLQKLTLHVSAAASMSGEIAYTPAGRMEEMMLPCPMTELMVTAPLTITGAVSVPGSTVISNTGMVVQTGASLTLNGGLSGTGVIEVANGGLLTLWGSALSYSGTIRLTGSAASITNNTSSPVTILNYEGKTVTVQPGESRTGDQPPEDPSMNIPVSLHPKISTNYGGFVSVENGGQAIVISTYDGYRVEAVVITGFPMGAITRYEFEAAGSDNTVEVTFARGQNVVGPQPVQPISFTDVSQSDSFSDAVFFLTNNGILQGVSSTRFAPYQLTNRAMFVSLLKRLEIYGSDFRLECEVPVLPADVNPTAWYAEPAAWAVGSELVKLGEDRLFQPSRLITREEAALYLYRLTRQRGYAAWVSASQYHMYSDAMLLEQESRTAMSWAAAGGYLPAKGSRLDPAGVMTRAQVAQMLALYLQTV